MAIVKTTAAALLLTLVLCALLGCASFVAAQKKDYEIVSTYVAAASSDSHCITRNAPSFPCTLLSCLVDNGWLCVAGAMNIDAQDRGG